MIKQLAASLVILLALTSCSDIAVMTTPKKQPIASHTPLAEQAERKFWITLHQGRYEDIPEATHLLTAAYLQNPNDPLVAAHLGFLHIWQIAERQREEKLDPTIVNHIILANKYFTDAVELNPKDARFLGFLGDAQLIEGKIFNDQRQQTRGYFTLKKAMHAWPQFNYFTAGYPMSSLPADSKHFNEGLEWQWQTLDICANATIDRKNPDFSPYMKLETQTGPARACWNSAIAPFNFEGFFLNMGDMLVKKGDWQTAVKIYNNAKLAKNYSAWPYAYLLEDRIKNAKINVKNFSHDPTVYASDKPITQKIQPEKVVLFNSGYGCVACHQEAHR